MSPNVADICVKFRTAQKTFLWRKNFKVLETTGLKFMVSINAFSCWVQLCRQLKCLSPWTQFWPGRRFQICFDFFVVNELFPHLLCKNYELCCCFDNYAVAFVNWLQLETFISCTFSRDVPNKNFVAELYFNNYYRDEFIAFVW